MPQKSDANQQPWQTLAIYAVLALLTFAVYWPTRGFDFVNYDDGDYVIGNRHVQSGLTRESMAWAFTTNHAANWHPLTWLSHELDCEMWGMKPGRMHLMNLLFHVANTLLLFGVLRSMTGAKWRSAIVAGLFAWHPTHVESVAWISERKDVLSTCCWLLTMGAYARYAREFEVRKSKFKAYYLLALLFFALGLMAKPMLVTLPFVLLLMDYWPLRRIHNLRFATCEPPNGKVGKESDVSLARAVLEKVPFLVLAVGSSAVTFQVQQKGGAVASLNAVPAGMRVANALVSYLRYVGKLLWPQNLSVLYPMPPSWSVALVIVAAIFVAGISTLAVWQARQRPYFFVGWFWFVGTLVPVIGLVQVGVQSMADRYLYVSAIGFFVAVAWGIAELAKGWPNKSEWLAAAAGIALAGCWLATAGQIQFWKDGETLFRHAVKATKNNYLAYNNLGYYLENHGKANNALEYYRKSVAINPGYEEALNNLGHALIARGEYVEAVVHLREALRIKPGLVEARNNLGNALGALGKMQEATEQYELALKYKSDDVDAHNNLGVERAKQGRLEEAERLLREAVQLKPTDVGAHSNLGNVLAMQKKWDEAMQEYRKALQINPGDSQTHYNLGNVLLQGGKIAEAAEQYAAAVKFKPENADAHSKLGLTLAAQGKRDEALAQFREALRLNPNDVDAQRRIYELQSPQ